LNLFKQIAQKELFKVTSLNSISVILKIAIGFVSAKVIAIFIGASGMALVGNLRNFVASVEGFATLGFTNGIVKYVAEKEENSQELKRYFSTIFFTLLSAILVCSLVLFLFAAYWNSVVFGLDFEYIFVIKAFALALPWYIGSLVIIAIINGFAAFKKVIVINIIGNVLGLLVTIGLIFKFQTFGALLAVVLSPAVLFFVTLFFIDKKWNLKSQISIKDFHFSVLKSMSEYSIMALFSIVLGPIIYLSIRTFIINAIGLNQAGYWEAVTRISTYYLLFLSTVLSVFYLPKLSKARTNDETKAIFRTYFTGIIPIFLIGLIAVYFLRFFIIRVLYTEEFLPISTLFFWQLLGDFFKGMSLILGFQFFAKKLTKAFLITELISLTILSVSSYYFITNYGIEGVVIAHAVTFFLYLVVLTIYFRKSIF
jgi:O-antigen/teichoic acid export membrane protein